MPDCRFDELSRTIAGRLLAKYRPPPDSSASAFCAENMSQILQGMALEGATDSAWGASHEFCKGWLFK